MTCASKSFFADPDVGRLCVLAIHGSASSGGQWRSLCGKLGDKARVMAPDLPGYGAATTEAETVDRLSYFEAIMAQTQLPLHLVAHSFGAAIALKLANLAPGLVRSVTLYDPMCPLPQDMHPDHLPADLSRVWKRIKDLPPVPAMGRFLDFWAGPGAWDSLPEASHDRLLTQHSSVLRDFHEIVSGYWSVNRPTYHGPLTIGVGALSPRAITDVRRHLTMCYPMARVRTLPGLRHTAPTTHAYQTDAFFQRAILRATDG